MATTTSTERTKITVTIALPPYLAKWCEEQLAKRPGLTWDELVEIMAIYGGDALIDA